jgi:hypothetical protein
MFRLLAELLVMSIPDVVGHLVARAVLHGTYDEGQIPGAARKSGFDDPVYQANLEKLIEYHRQFEKKQ